MHFQTALLVLNAVLLSNAVILKSSKTIIYKYCEEFLLSMIFLTTHMFTKSEFVNQQQKTILPLYDDREQRFDIALSKVFCSKYWSLFHLIDGEVHSLFWHQVEWHFYRSIKF